MAISPHPHTFHCAAFAITSRKAGGNGGNERWLVNPAGLHWHDMFGVPATKTVYEEATFTQIAILSGWRLTKVVPVSAKERRLYYERVC
ncbi:MAG TPA: hypothetical protein VK066_03860 [Chloroflexota bacterium]|nr:hypothetical protein [Chloroflexota bacterium]